MTKQTSKKTKATILELQPLTQSLKARGPVRFLRQDESGQLYLDRKKVSAIEAVQWYASATRGPRDVFQWNDAAFSKVLNTVARMAKGGAR